MWNCRLTGAISNRRYVAMCSAFVLLAWLPTYVQAQDDDGSKLSPAEIAKRLKETTEAYQSLVELLPSQSPETDRLAYERTIEYLNWYRNRIRALGGKVPGTVPNESKQGAKVSAALVRKGTASTAKVGTAKVGVYLGMPIPKFKRLEDATLADALLKSQKALRAHLIAHASLRSAWEENSKDQKALNALIKSQAKTNELVVDMVLAEEMLMWSVGGPFTAEEQAKLKAAITGPVAKIKAALKKAKVSGDAFREIQKDMSTVEAIWDSHLKLHHATGKANFMTMAFSRLLHLRMSADLEIRRKAFQSQWSTIQSVLSGMDDSMRAVYSARRARGLKKINAQLPSGFQFKVHRPSSQKEQQIVELRIKKFIFSMTDKDNATKFKYQLPDKYRENFGQFLGIAKSKKSAAGASPTEKIDLRELVTGGEISLDEFRKLQGSISP